MIVRSIDGNNDWKFGKGRNDYKRDNSAVAQMIKTRLQSFLGDCFFAIDEGIDWFNLLGGKGQIAITIAIGATILNTENVVSMIALDVDLDNSTRRLNAQYKVATAYSTISDSINVAIPSF